MDKIRELNEARIGPLMLKYFIPAFIGVFVNALYNIVDRIFIGQGVGAEALSGISVIFPIMLIMMAFGMLVGIGTGVYVSISMGKNELARAERTPGNSLILMLVIFLIPLLFILPGSMGLKGIWVSFPVADMLSAVVVCFLLIREWRWLHRGLLNCFRLVQKYGW